MKSQSNSPHSRLWGARIEELQPGAHLPSSSQHDGGGFWLGASPQDASPQKAGASPQDASPQKAGCHSHRESQLPLCK